MTWTKGPVEGVVIKPLKRYRDERGWLSEFFREDELDANLLPVMGYLSMTYPGVARGPHEHIHQTDLFLFFNGLFRLYLWDTRVSAKTYGHRATMDLDGSSPVLVIVPPRIVHAYKNIGATEALIVNCPNRLYAGENKIEPVDEIRHEELPHNPFIID